MKFQYAETPEAAAAYREEYLNAVQDLVVNREAQLDDERLQFLKRIFKEPECCRNEFASMFGWPLTEERKPAASVKETFLGHSAGRRVSRLRIEVLPGLPFYGLLFRFEDDRPRPFLFSQHGGLGTPELCSSLYPDGSANYNDQTQRLLKYDVNVFAPQLLLWNMQDETGANTIDNVRQDLDARLKTCGGSITAMELYALQVTLDWFCTQPYVDTDRIGMAGLSYGGMYTMLMTALDTRIRSSVSSSFFGAFSSWIKSDIMWQSSRSLFEDAEIAALCWPRRIWLGMGMKDELFDYRISTAQYDRLCAATDLPIREKLRFEAFDGTHEFPLHDDPIKEMMCDLNAPLV